jgi:hypothetical protein
VPRDPFGKLKKAKKKYARHLPPATQRMLPAKPPAVLAEVVQDIRNMTDAQIETRVYVTRGPIPDFLVRGDFKPVLRRAYASLDRSKELRKGGTLYTPEEMEDMARIVAAFHVCRHTPRAERTPDWPKDAAALAALLSIEHRTLREAIYQSRYHAWEERYVPEVSSAARVSRIKDSLEYNVLRQDEVSDPSKVNANLYRTALQAEGAIQSAKGIQFNVNSNVVNMPEGTTEQMIRERLQRLQKFAARLEPKETEHVEVLADQDGREEDGRSHGPEAREPVHAASGPGPDEARGPA